MLPVVSRVWGTGTSHAAGRLELQDAERDGVDGRGGGGGLIVAIELLAAGEGQVAAVERVVGGTELSGEGGGGTIVGQGRQDGVGGGSGIESVDLAGALVGAEEEELPGADGAAQGGAELVLFEIGFGLSGGGAEEGVGVEEVIADEFPGVAVKFMLAAFGDEGGAGDLRAVDRVVLRSLDL